MTIPVDYTTLQTEVANWLARPGVDVTTFIRLAEVEMEKKLRVREMICRASTLINEEYEQLPASFLDLIDVTLINTDAVSGNVTKARLEYMTQYQGTPDTLMSITANGTQPCFYSIIGEQIHFFPPPPDTDSPYSVELHYFGRFDYLADAVGGVNSILTRYPTIYLYGSLLYAAPFYGAGHRKAEWAEQFYGEIEQANSQYEEASYGTMSISMAS
ncbi:MAG: phage adaptor protein [Pseudomonadales bacterium]